MPCDTISEDSAPKKQTSSILCPRPRFSASCSPPPHQGLCFNYLNNRPYSTTVPLYPLAVHVSSRWQSRETFRGIMENHPPSRFAVRARVPSRLQSPEPRAVSWNTALLAASLRAQQILLADSRPVSTLPLCCHDYKLTRRIPPSLSSNATSLPDHRTLHDSVVPGLPKESLDSSVNASPLLAQNVSYSSGSPRQVANPAPLARGTILSAVSAHGPILPILSIMSLCLRPDVPMMWKPAAPRAPTPVGAHTHPPITVLRPLS